MQYKEFKIKDLWYKTNGIHIDNNIINNMWCMNQQHTNIIIRK